MKRREEQMKRKRKRMGKMTVGTLVELLKSGHFYPKDTEKLGTVPGQR
jgi:hypothetical protein